MRAPPAARHEVSRIGMWIKRDDTAPVIRTVLGYIAF
jgi:hypothetical protein